MSKCDLSIELARNPPHYRPGEKVQGKLHVSVNDACRCDELSMKLLWRTHGRGNQESGGEVAYPLGAFDWAPGEATVHDFSFAMPAGPVSYHGEIINVDWYLVGRADVPWALDPKVEQDILLLPAPPESRPSDTYRGVPATAPAYHSLGPGARSTGQPPWMKLAALGVFFAFFAVFFGPSLFEDGRPNLPLLAFLTVALFFAGRLVWSDLRNAAARTRLGDIRLSVDSPAAARGQLVVLRASFVPQDKVRLNRVTATLVGEESAVSGSGTRKTTHKHVLGTATKEVAAAVTAEKGQPTELTCTLEIPGDAAPTFRATDNRVQWRVIVSFDVESWPDLEEVLEIDVLPT